MAAALAGHSGSAAQWGVSRTVLGWGLMVGGGQDQQGCGLMVVGQGSGRRATKEGAVALETLAAAPGRRVPGRGWGRGQGGKTGNMGSSEGRAAVALGGCAAGPQVLGCGSHGGRGVAAGIKGNSVGQWGSHGMGW